ncbi:hypothetical protein [Sphingomonas sp. LT1P40]|uniref:hypothetical protein n=1 Tax=Alteristakelama amylovorans TaxID=3096166 RepID=UPI002FC86A40
MTDRGVSNFWSDFRLRLVAFSRIYISRCGITSQIEPEDIAQDAIDETMQHLDRELNYDWRAHIMAPHVRAIAFKYAKVVAKNAVIDAIRHSAVVRKHASTLASKASEEGVFQFQPARVITPEEFSIANDFVQRIIERTSTKRAEGMRKALHLIVNEDGGDLGPKDLAKLADMSANELSYERRKIRSVLGKNIGRSKCAGGDDGTE